MTEVPASMAAELFGVSVKHFHAHIKNLPGFPEPSSNWGRRKRWRYADLVRFKEGRA